MSGVDQSSHAATQPTTDNAQWSELQKLRVPQLANFNKANLGPALSIDSRGHGSREAKRMNGVEIRHQVRLLILFDGSTALR